ncbi:hypothetical protein [Patulibacter americanus]|uniref:hypothetical protein n=1 Tax=Patulibacter americanus TaxID=588672 RepID=UPI0003B31160|nr:hypothetical protein [Patulibacter americanus]
MSRKTVIQDLRRTIDCLPLATRVAMLEGVREETIIVGAYTDGTGGVCPMLAAHRHGGRTSFLQFARTWDAFAKAPARGSRPAKERELRILERHLEASIAASEGEVTGGELAEAIAEHRTLVARSRAAQPTPEPGESRRRTAKPNRGAPRLPGWIRPIGSVAEYEAVLEQVDRQRIRLGLVGDTAGPAPRDAAESRQAREDHGVSTPEPARR